MNVSNEIKFFNLTNPLEESQGISSKRSQDGNAGKDKSEHLKQDVDGEAEATQSPPQASHAHELVLYQPLFPSTLNVPCPPTHRTLQHPDCHSTLIIGPDESNEDKDDLVEY
ncbi:hypothetical protein JR316_0006498 [Psilocybe cubensis]|uniref:Uncharacterized protein n=1 Tax=Psilocybe cubensis TaxID=181762 RepID=A0ACB8H1T7_PSICU|nr:hypothetical protein JR316_0006498 [Psilocybe cubensis]KAH9481968.1 hypothetical protein JR316_0006498 [Psilocybe cubensis]